MRYIIRINDTDKWFINLSWLQIPIYFEETVAVCAITSWTLTFLKAVQSTLKSDLNFNIQPTAHESSTKRLLLAVVIAWPGPFPRPWLLERGCGSVAWWASLLPPRVRLDGRKWPQNSHREELPIGKYIFKFICICMEWYLISRFLSVLITFT